MDKIFMLIVFTEFYATVHERFLRLFMRSHSSQVEEEESLESGYAKVIRSRGMLR